jgi:transposase-like protein
MKILSSGRVWGRGIKTGEGTRQRIVKLLQSSDVPIRTIALRFGISINIVSAINTSESIRPKGHRPERIY